VSTRRPHARLAGLACLLALACERTEPAPHAADAGVVIAADVPDGGDERLAAASSAHASSPVDRQRDACLAHNPAPARYEGIVRAFCSEHAHLGGVGASLAVAERGRLVFTAVTGARCRDGPPVTVDTAFRLGSLTKLATAALVLDLADERRLDLHAPLRELADFSDPRARDITPQQLLEHTAGLGDPDPRDLAAPRRAAPTAQADPLAATARDPLAARHDPREAAPTAQADPRGATIRDDLTARDHLARDLPWRRALAARPLLADPGLLWSYSNAGYALLGAALERLAPRTSYPKLLQDRLLTPLQLAHTTADIERALAGDTACGHLGRGPAALALDVRQDLEFGAAGATWTIPAGGLLGSAADQVALVLGLLDPARSPLSPAARAALLAPGPLTHERPGERYAPGLRVQRLSDGTPLYRHGGRTGDFTADLSFAPDRGFVLVVLGNTGDPLLAVLAAAHHDLLGEPPRAPAPALPLDRYAGTYAVPGWTAALTIEGGALTAPDLGLAAAPLEPLGDHRFRIGGAPRHLLTFVFLADPDRPTHLRTREFIATRTP